MSNNYGFSEAELKPIKKRDKKCVYCNKKMDRTHTGKVRSDWTTIEHLSEKKPFYKKDGLEIDGLAICCWSCNSSRGKKTLREWFGKPYCKARNTHINEDSVADPVKEYLKRNK